MTLFKTHSKKIGETSCKIYLLQCVLKEFTEIKCLRWQLRTMPKSHARKNFYYNGTNGPLNPGPFFFTELLKPLQILFILYDLNRFMQLNPDP